MLIGWKHLASVIAAGAVTVFAVAWLGLVGVGASTGHWAITDWFLHWVMRSSIRTAAIGAVVPPLDDPAMLPMAAGHYEIGCAGCHGSPAMPRPAFASGMLPPPPDLSKAAAEWSDAELSQIVNHGVRFTGMPAWPARGRDDEVWAMVAFLRRYPSLDAASYRDLAGFSTTRAAEFDRVLDTCNGCHAAERLSATSLIPRLDGQSVAYLKTSIDAYQSGMRPSGVMQLAAVGLTAEEKERLAEHFSTRHRDPQRKASGQLMERGRILAETGDAAAHIPPCLGCHDRSGGNPAYPKLAGQSAAYIETQLRLFVEGTRGGGAYRELMHTAAKNLREEDFRPLAAYFAGKSTAP